jgi:preprotein translocase subunit SecG
MGLEFTRFTVILVGLFFCFAVIAIVKDNARRYKENIRKEEQYKETLSCPENMGLIKTNQGKFYCAYMPKKKENNE